MGESFTVKPGLVGDVWMWTRSNKESRFVLIKKSHTLTKSFTATTGYGYEHSLEYNNGIPVGSYAEMYRNEDAMEGNPQDGYHCNWFFAVLK